MKFAILNLYLICFVGLNAQIVPINMNDDWETWTENIKVSGETRVGLIDDYYSKNFIEDHFNVYIPRICSDRVCVQISSRDGRYSADLIYDVSDVCGGEVLFSFPTNYKRKLRQFETEDISILASCIGNCEDDKELFLISNWLSPEKSDSIKILINSQVSANFIIEDTLRKTSKEFYFYPIKKEGNRSFNQISIIHKSELSAGSNCKIIQKRLTLNSEVMLNPLIFNIALLKKD